MLIEFAVENFRSFRDRQSLSMVAAPRLQRRENLFEPKLDGEAFPRLLKVAAIYGPNASGKSNLVSALSVVRTLALRVPSAQPTPLPVAHFRFDRALASQPSRFEFNFTSGQQRYEFTLAATKDRIDEEKLVGFPRGKETLLYQRKNVTGHDEYEYGKDLEGGSQVHDTWRRLTAPDQLFLSQAVANSNAELQQLRIPFRWLTNEVMTIPATSLRDLAPLAQRLVQHQPGYLNTLVDFIRDLDIPITHLTFDPESEKLPTTTNEATTWEAASKFLANPNVKTTFTHKTALGEAAFEFQDESMGTQSLIGFFAVWMILQTSGAPRWSTLAIDELDTSLHPIIVHEIVRRFIEKPTPSQLIFTTHDTHLMDSKLLRRDQIWLTERDTYGATQLRSVHDFSGREGEDIEKRYYEGRYRSLPIVRSE